MSAVVGQIGRGSADHDPTDGRLFGHVADVWVSILSGKLDDIASSACECMARQSNLFLGSTWHVPGNSQ